MKSNKTLIFFSLFIIHEALFSINSSELIEAIRQQNGEKIIEIFNKEFEKEALEAEEEKWSKELEVENLKEIFDLLQEIMESDLDLNAMLKFNDFKISVVDFLFAMVINLPMFIKTVEILDQLLQKGANINNQIQEEYTEYIDDILVSHTMTYKPYFSVIIDDYEVDLEKAMYLLNHGADINGRDSNGETALMHIVKNEDLKLDKRLKLIKFLIDNKADIQLKNNNGKTALDLARDLEQIEVVELFENLSQE